MKNYNELANCIRFLSIDAVEKAKSGHPGMPMGMADIATVLFHNFLVHNPNDPSWLKTANLVEYLYIEGRKNEILDIVSPLFTI